MTIIAEFKAEEVERAAVAWAQTAACPFCGEPVRAHVAVSVNGTLSIACGKSPPLGVIFSLPAWPDGPPEEKP